MNIKNKNKLKNIKSIFEKENIIYKELKNGQIQIDKVNFWATTEKWYDPIRNKKGAGINSFLKYLKDNEVI